MNDIKNNKKQLALRYVLFILGLFFAGVGVAVTKRGELGVSPISSVANVISGKFTFFSFGTWLIIWNCVLILGQILILRKNFRPVEFFQIPLSFLFGRFTDLGMFFASLVPADSYPARIFMVLLGVVILAFGISLSVCANVILNSGEALVKAISDTLHKEFGTVKVFFDISCVVTALVLSLIMFDFTVVGIREGTVISAVCTGFAIRFFTGKIKAPVSEFVGRFGDKQE